MPFNVMIQLCKITRASKLFQRNFYLPLLKPLSPREALRDHLITGKNVLEKIEHYIPVLEEYKARVKRRRRMQKGLGKKRQRKKENMRYLMPFFDEELEGHTRLKRLLANKSKGRGQCYTYYVSDKYCTLVFSHKMERAIRDKDIVDVLIAQRSEKIVVVLKDMTKVTLPIAPYGGNAPFYRGEGWTRREVEEAHHHGRETMSVVKIFEAQEAGAEEWELEMMRMAAKRKKKQKGEGTADWKAMMNTTVDYMDWDQFEEDAQQIVEEANEPVDDQPIPMEVDDMEKTKNVNEKLKNAGEEVLSKLPVMPEIPEIIEIIKVQGNLTEIANVSGVTVNLKSSNKQRFIPGQMVKSEDGELFVPGQTITNEQGVAEYTPGFTVLLDREPTLIPGLVMGNDPNKAMFLPGESTITESGELQFTEMEDDVKEESSPANDDADSVGEEPTPVDREPTPVEEEPTPVKNRSTSDKKEPAPVKKEPTPVKKDPIPVKKKRPPYKKKLSRLQKAEPETKPKAKEVELEEEQIMPYRPPPRKRDEEEFVYERPKRQYVQYEGPKHRERGPKKEPPKKKFVLQIDWNAEPKEKFKEPVFYDLTSPVLATDLLLQRKQRVSAFAQKKTNEEVSIDKRRRDIKLKVKQILEYKTLRREYVPLAPVRKSEKLIELETMIKSGNFFSLDYRKYLSKRRHYRFNWLEPRASRYTSRYMFHSVGIMRRRLWK